ncbi:MAG: hypothetical protein V3V19_11360 [Cocleimonas sp.]
MTWHRDKDGNWVESVGSKEGEPVRMDHKTAVAKSIIAGAYSVNKFGENPDVDAAEDMTDTGFTWDLFPSGAQTVSIVSSDDEDGGAGTDTGALTIFIEGIDENDAKVSETINLNGTTPVVSTKTYKLLFRAIIRTAGSVGANIGNITCTGSTDSGTTMFVILIGNNQTLMCVFAIETSKEGFIHGIKLRTLRTAGVAVSAEITLLAKPNGEVWQVKERFSMETTGDSAPVVLFDPPKQFDPLTLFKLNVSNVSTTNLLIGGSMDITVEPVQ